MNGFPHSPQDSHVTGSVGSESPALTPAGATSEASLDELSDPDEYPARLEAIADYAEGTLGWSRPVDVHRATSERELLEGYGVCGRCYGSGCVGEDGRPGFTHDCPRCGGTGIKGGSR